MARSSPAAAPAAAPHGSWWLSGAVIGGLGGLAVALSSALTVPHLPRLVEGWLPGAASLGGLAAWIAPIVLALLVGVWAAALDWLARRDAPPSLAHRAAGFGVLLVPAALVVHNVWLLVGLAALLHALACAERARFGHALALVAVAAASLASLPMLLVAVPAAAAAAASRAGGRAWAIPTLVLVALVGALIGLALRGSPLAVDATTLLHLVFGTADAPAHAAVTSVLRPGVLLPVAALVAAALLQPTASLGLRLLAAMAALLTIAHATTSSTTPHALLAVGSGAVGLGAARIAERYPVLAVPVAAALTGWWLAGPQVG